MNGPTLDSWKEIARYLGKDVKTCQRWEKERGLPVHRLEGSKRSRVFAYPEELTAWLQKNDVVGPAANGAPRPPKERRIFPYLAGALTVIAVLAAYELGVFAFLLPAAKRRAALIESNPADFHIVGSSLVVVNAAGAGLWSFDTCNEKLVGEQTYHAPQAFAEQHSQVAFPFILIKDINHDGFSEVVFSTQTTDNFGEGDLYGFDHKGRLLWNKIHVGGRHRFGGVEFAADYRIEGLAAADLDGDGDLEIMVMVAHMQDWPSALLVVKPDGRIMGEYWNGGRITYLAWADIDGDGTQEILAVGTNNEYGKACLIVLDPKNMHGYSPQIEAADTDGEFGRGTEEYYVLLPRTDVDLVNSPPREGMERIDLPENRTIRVMPERSKVIFELGYDLSVLSVGPSYYFETEHERLLQQGKIKSRLGPAYYEALKSGVLYWDGRAWVAHRASSRDRAARAD